MQIKDLLKKNIVLILILSFVLVLFAGCEDANSHTEPKTQPDTEYETVETTDKNEPQPTEQKTEKPTEAPTEAPTDAPTEEPTRYEPQPHVSELPRDKYNLRWPIPALTEEQLALCLQPAAKRTMEYFKDSVFLGDSVTLGLKKYAAKMREKNPDFLSNARFIAIGSYGVYEALQPISKESMHATYNGVQTLSEDILASMNAKRVFILLGLNDCGLFSIKEHLELYEEYIKRIRAKCPEIEIVIMSTTPLTVEGEKKHLNSRVIDDHNAAILEKVADWGCYYADIASVVKDTDGYLADQLSSDNYCHLVYEAYDLIIDYLLRHPVP